MFCNVEKCKNIMNGSNKQWHSRRKQEQLLKPSAFFYHCLTFLPSSAMPKAMNRVPEIELCLKNMVICTCDESIIKKFNGRSFFSECAFIRAQCSLHM